MSKTQNILIFKKTYELALSIFKVTKLFPKSQRFLMADRLEEAVINILEHIIQANAVKEKAPFLEKASMSLERIRILVRLSKDLTYIDFKNYEKLSQAADEIGRMLGGWIKYSKTGPAQNSL